AAASLRPAAHGRSAWPTTRLALPAGGDGSNPARHGYAVGDISPRPRPSTGPLLGEHRRARTAPAAARTCDPAQSCHGTALTACQARAPASLDLAIAARCEDVSRSSTLLDAPNGLAKRLAAGRFKFFAAKVELSKVADPPRFRK